MAVEGLKTTPLFRRSSVVVPSLFVRSLQRPFIGAGNMLKRGWNMLKWRRLLRNTVLQGWEEPLDILHDRVKAWAKTGFGVCDAGA